MGCQSSKLDHQKEEILPKLPPLFGRKLEEIRRRWAGSTLSKKQLLDKDPETDDDSIGSTKVAPEPEPTEPEEIFSDKDVIAEEKSKEDDNKDNNNDNAEDEEKVIEKLGLEDKEDRHKVEEYGKFSSRTYPGSPSFRFYLTDQSIQEKEDDQTDKDDYMNKVSLSDTDVDAAEIVESQTSNEELETKIKKRGRKGMRFRRVIPMGKPVFVCIKY